MDQRTLYETYATLLIQKENRSTMIYSDWKLQIEFFYIRPVVGTSLLEMVKEGICKPR
jgi:hypothetical protein